MNKTIRTMALLSVLSIMAVGCQKENASDYLFEASVSESDNMYVVMYFIDGVQNQMTLHSIAGREEFLFHLFDMAKNGHEVVFYDGNRTSQNATTTKDVVRYSTSEEKDAYDWGYKMMEDGYTVRVTYDSEKKVYNRVAWK